jgi:hypothetical protein
MRFNCRFAELNTPVKVEGTLKGSGSTRETVRTQSGLTV